ncbi:L-glyceraldehyde 3-phosphate reductase [Cedecea neteri]|uniref:L-glyceraldehyde 3-phosphate reductase n=1 Tax=Cedecea neteri TaxID=158822 RepID=A0A2X2TJ59_9ENTR|nr:L-glyceraldehyde 3-phosphate reductase [Cedecea neteri]
MWPGPYGSGGSRKYLLASLDQSLKRMGLEYVDIFYSHRVDERTPMEETAARWHTRCKAVKRSTSDFLLLLRTYAKNGRSAARMEDSAAYPSTLL